MQLFTKLSISIIITCDKPNSTACYNYLMLFSVSVSYNCLLYKLFPASNKSEAYNINENDCITN